MKQKNIITVAVYLVLCGILIGGMSMWLAPNQPQDLQNSSEEITQTNEDIAALAPLSLDEMAAYQTTMTNDNNPVAEVVTNRGTFTLELFEDTMPVTAGNFITLAEEGFYNGIQFHRIIPGFMIQGGDPITKTDEFMRYGTGGPGYSIPDEHVAGEYLTNVRGTISMANSGPNSGGSQFFINVADNVNLDFDKEPLSSQHPVFGRVLSGMDIVDAISEVETNERDLPTDPVVIESVSIKRP